jgi:hypothetical protein
MKASGLKESMKVGNAVEGLLGLLGQRHPKEMTLAMARQNFSSFLVDLEDDTKAAVSTEAAGDVPAGVAE